LAVLGRFILDTETRLVVADWVVRRRGVQNATLRHEGVSVMRFGLGATYGSKYARESASNSLALFEENV
jgi:hypothetical protein